ncbi:MAG: hypothetical protein IPM54_15705 [Polyangiaceae bacterium]|nr:hypothetical protein [Polyangiaceae bacterium]
MLPLARTWFLVCLPCFLSCSGQSNAPAKTPPQPSWTGTWALVPGLAVSPDKRIVLPRTCERSPEYWTIDQSKSQITLELHESVVASGVKMAVERRKIERAEGQLRGSFVHLDGETGTEVVRHDEPNKNRPATFPVTYELEYDPKTEHLAGTRNGAPVRFIRAELAPVDYTRCKPVP